MQNLINDLIDTLQKDERLVIDGKLVKNKIVELALAMDEGLLKLLLSNNSIKRHFFKTIHDVLVFDKVAFQSFVSNKQFLPDSYTAFKNKIGLTANHDFLTESKEVVLAWPYKDCVLEGGQTKEDQKRNELFWNETLAPEQIDRLLEPKVLTNFKLFDNTGEHKVKDFNKFQSLIIKGNNLLALQSLKKKYTGKVNLIYLDPPYNTENDSFCYNDTFTHSTWLTFMKSRLEAAYELLSTDGSIYIQLDYNEVHYMKVLMDEIFGRENFQSQIIWKRTYSKGDAKTFGTSHDTILFYSKSESFYFKKTFTDYEDAYIARFSHEDERGKFQDRNLSAKGLKGGGYKYTWKGVEGFYRCPEKTMKKLDDDNRIYYTKTGTPRMKQYLHEMEGRAVQDIWSDINVINSQSSERVGYSTQKPEKLLKRIIESSSREGDIVLDFFMGSSTTQAVAHKMKRQFIGIEQLDYADDVSIGRLLNVLQGDQGGISKEVNWKGGGSFIYCELKKLNESIIENLEKIDKRNDLLQLFIKLKDNNFLDYRVLPEPFENFQDEFQNLSNEEKRKLLIELLDKNSLYVNYSDIDDAEFNISDEDKLLNDVFYGETKK